MTPPELHDVKQTSRLVRMSVSWLYRNADRLGVTRMGNRLFWTDEQVTQIITEAACPPKSQVRTGTSPRSHSAPVTKTEPARSGSGLSNFRSRPEAARKVQAKPPS